MLVRFTAEPANHSLAHRIAWLLGRRGEYSRMIPYLEAAIRSASGEELAEYIGTQALATAREDPQAAVPVFERAIGLARSPGKLCRDLASFCWSRLRDSERGRYWFIRALRENPADDRSYLGLCEILIEGRAADGALRALHESISPLVCDELTASHCIGVSLQAWGRYPESQEWCDRVLDKYPDFQDVIVCAAQSLERMGELDAAGRLFARVDPLQPRQSHKKQYILNAVLEYLDRTQQWEAARALMFGLDLSKECPSGTPQPWNGECIEGRTFVIEGMGGFGDMLQFVRYAEKLRAAGARAVTILCSLRLLDLLKSVDGVTEALLYGEEAVGDFHDPLMFLVRRLPDGLRPWVGKMPYVRPPADARVRGRGRVPDRGRLRVGVAWSGNDSYGGSGFLGKGSFRDRYLCRTVPFSTLIPLFSVPNVDFYSLQHGSGREELSGSAMLNHVVDLEKNNTGFVETAAAIEQLDLIITIDSAAAHLAGALNRPTLLLLPYCSEWRWTADGGHSGWYPSVRLLRQPAPGDWAFTVTEATRIVSELSMSRRTPQAAAARFSN